MATNSAVLNDFASQLAGLKKAYGTATQPDDVQKQAAQLRNQAFSSGVDLNQLEDSANQVGGFKTSSSPEENAWRETTFNTAKTATALPQIPTISPMNVAATNSNTYLDSYNKLATQYQQLVNTPFTFNPENDPTYQAAVKLSDTQAKTASKNALETMNDRGIINSSVTSNQLGQIQTAAQQKPLELIPQLQQQAYSQNQQGISNIFGLMGNQMQMGLAQQQLPMQEAALTGKYAPSGMTDLINRILADKQGYGNDLSTSVQKQNYTNDAQAARDALSAKYGMDANALYGSQVDYGDALKNASGAGQMTVAQQQTMLNAINGLGSTYGSLPTGSGKVVSGLPNYSNLGSLYTGLEGKPTLGQQGQNTSLMNAQTSASNANRAAAPKSVSDLDQIKLNTQAAANSILLKSTNKDDAYAFINAHQQELLDSGVDMQTLQDAIEKNPKWAPPKPTTPTSKYSQQVTTAAMKAMEQVSPTDPEYNKKLEAQLQYFQSVLGK